MAKAHIHVLIKRDPLDMSIMVFGKKMLEMVSMDNASITMKNFILVIGSKIKDMDRETISTNMKKDILENGDMI
jgi:hypothetical protein